MSRVVVVLPSQTYRATDFVKAAGELGVDLIVVSEVDAPFDMGNRYLVVDCADPHEAAEEIVRLGDEAPIDGVVAADDSGVIIAAIAGTRLGLLANDPDAAEATRNKATMRRRFQQSEVPQPRWAEHNPDARAEDVAESIGYPLVAKPLGKAAGQGVIRVDRPQDLVATIDRIREIVSSSPQENILLEEYLPGEEVIVEGLITPDGLLILSLFDKPHPLQGTGFQETILVTPSRQPESVQKECRRVAGEAVGALGLTHGPVHVELMVSDTRVSVIEVAARSIGGLCSRSLHFGLMDTSLEALILRNALGRDKPELRRATGASGVLMIPIPRAGTFESLSGVDEVKSVDGVTGIDLTVAPGDVIQPPPEGDRYLGFVFVEGDDRDTVEKTLVDARNQLKVNLR